MRGREPGFFHLHATARVWYKVDAFRVIFLKWASAHFFICESLLMAERSVITGVEQLLGPVLSAGGMELVEVSFKLGRGRGLLQVFIDKPGGVTLDDCQAVSRELGTLLDVEDVIPGAYVLEVSSPGLDRPLKTVRDFERNLGKAVTVKARGEQGRPVTVTGRIAGVTGDAVEVASEDEVLSVRLADIVKAKLQLEF